MAAWVTVVSFVETKSTYRPKLSKSYVSDSNWRDKFGESLGGSQGPPASGKSDFPGSSPNFPGGFSATSLAEVLSLWNLSINPGVPRKLPRLYRIQKPKDPWTPSPFSGKPDALA